MKRLSIAISILSATLFSGTTNANAQQLIKVYTTSARLFISIPVNADDPSSFFSVNTQNQFQFESASSKLFHNEISNREPGANDPYANSRAVQTTVQVNDVESEANILLTMEAVVSMTFSQVGIYKALQRSPLTGGVEEKVAINLASLLSKVISKDELTNTLVMAGIIPDGYDEDLLEVTFESFDGDSDERGMYTKGEMQIVSNGKNGGWAMFFSGIFFTLVFGSSIAVGSWVYKTQHGHWPFPPNIVESKDIVIHHDEDVESAELVVQNDGYLGLKGHHPSAASKENSHPNGAAYRRKRIGNSTSGADDEAYDDNATQATFSSKHPLGIKSIRKLNTPFFTPQKPKSRPSLMYDVERLTKSDEKSVKSNAVLFD